MSMEYKTGVRDDEALRASFNALTRRVFGFDFEDWHTGGWWTAARTGYTPHALAENGEIVASVSTTPMTFDLAGERLRALQFGTVMTAPERRGEGLSRRLMERALEEAAGRYDMIYLYANDSVMEFYPRFGFVPAVEYEFSRAMPEGAAPAAAQADMGDAAAREALLRRFALGNPFSAASLLDNSGLIMFYCGGFLRDAVFFIDALDAAAVAEYEGDTLLLHDVFCPAGAALDDVLRALARPGVTRAALGFTPADPRGFERAPVQEDGGLFVLKGLRNPFAARPMRLPTLSHT